MSRSGYRDDCDQDWDFIMYRGAVASAMRGKRGQAFLKEMLAAMDGMEHKRLIAWELEEPVAEVPCSHWGLFITGGVCAIGAVGEERGVNMADLDPEDADNVAKIFGIAPAMAREIVWENDEAGPHKETPEQRFERMRKWISGMIRDPSTPESEHG